MTGNVSPKRFYKDVATDQLDGRYRILLDSRPARTRGKNLLTAPTQALADAIAGEWDAQSETIDQISMPLTGVMAAAIDGGESAAQTWLDEILNYLGSDLVCYRADEPAELVERQAAVWDPYLDFARAEFGAPLMKTQGIIAVSQPQLSIDAVRSHLAEQPPETLFALRLATAITGSAVLALALWRNAYGPEEIFEASLVDERFQEQRWGVDEEAMARQSRLGAEFASIARFLNLVAADY
ncbi:hypothetical protein PUV54_13745 [Hyphococcus flavus]|uniref:ATPase n=1 Tax=Hyphococcus flavus TaxID=1866326 RepID=A0AAF0CGS1_9PROT|nr:ATP12 family protein [Hyphococcus flavus]WDI31017.1 hypothetical protein PUV54_13745 [Hyphococcus flavus]